MAGVSKTMSEWISVKDQTPKIGRFVCLIGGKMFLGCTEDKYGSLNTGYEIKYSNKGVLKINPDFDFDLIVFGWIKPSHYGDVTHWTPLPELPDE